MSTAIADRYGAPELGAAQDGATTALLHYLLDVTEPS
jgi:hypothetical protein